MSSQMNTGVKAAETVAEHPMPNIPVEVWIIIFLNVIRLDPTFHMSLMSVSWTWRRVASGTPQLWTRLVLERRRDFTDASYARFFLKHYPNRPLDVYLEVPNDVQDTSCLAALLRGHVSRFRTLVVHTRTHAIADTLLSSIGEAQSGPLLERLKVTIAQEPSELISEFAALRNAFQPAPCLTHISLPAYPVPPNTNLLSTITSLTLDAIQFGSNIVLHAILNLLSSIPHLLRFKFKGSDNFSYTDLSGEPVVPMPCLTSADVSVPGCGLDILCNLRAPSLADVTFDGWRDEGYYEDWNESLTEPVLSSLRLLSRHSPMIKRIELRSTVFPDSMTDYPWLLSDDTFPNLKILRLDATDITDDALRRCLDGHQNLERLELCCCNEVSGFGLFQFIVGCNTHFQLLLDRCLGVAQEDITALSKVVKVESKAGVGSF